MAKTTVTVREYDEQGRMVKETITESVYDNYTWTYPYRWTPPYTVSWGSSSGSISAQS